MSHSPCSTSHCNHDDQLSAPSFSSSRELSKFVGFESSLDDMKLMCSSGLSVGKSGACHVESHESYIVRDHSQPPTTLNMSEKSAPADITAQAANG